VDARRSGAPLRECNCDDRGEYPDLLYTTDQRDLVVPIAADPARSPPQWRCYRPTNQPSKSCPERRRGAPVVGGRSFRPARHQSVLRSCQFGLLSAPMFPHFEQIIRGPIAGTGTSSSQRLVVITTSWRHSWHAINRVDAVAPHVAERHGLDRNVGATWCHRLDPSPWYTEDGGPRPAGHRRRGAARTRDNRRPERRL
jgi:hypothetical protein